MVRSTQDGTVPDYARNMFRLLTYYLVYDVRS
jgi:hypothetical protein